jgi:hypothetical protein
MFTLSQSSLFRPAKYGFTAVVIEYMDIYWLSKYDFDDVVVIFNRSKPEMEATAIEAGLTEAKAGPPEPMSNIDQIEGKKGPPKDSTESQIKFVREQIALQTKCINALVEGKGSPASD